jgi:DNA segregation ATPase FtsK/SpoIIIE, S-DNA-T family
VTSPFVAALPSVPVGTGMSIFDPVFLGVDEFGHPVYLPMIYRNILMGGEPGAGKSSLLNTIVGTASFCHDVNLCLLDGTQVDLGLFEDCADVFVGPDLDLAIFTLERLQTVMDNRYAYLRSVRRQKFIPADAFGAILVAIDEIAYFSATAGEKKDQERFSALLRDLVARGRKVGLIVAAATQRPSSDIIPPSLRDLFAWRFAGRCTNDVSSDIVLGHGWAARGYSSNTVDPNNQGCGLLIGEGGIPAMVKAAYMSTADIIRVADYAAWVRRTTTETNLTAELRAVA